MSRPTGPLDGHFLQKKAFSAHLTGASTAIYNRRPMMNEPNCLVFDCLCRFAFDH